MTLIGVPSSTIPAVPSFALIAPVSLSYSTNAIPFLPGTSLTSLKPSNLAKIPSISTPASGKPCTNRILLGGRYSSGMTGAAEALVDLRPAPREALMGPVARGTLLAAAVRLRAACCVASSRAFFLSIHSQSAINPKTAKRDKILREEN